MALKNLSISEFKSAVNHTGSIDIVRNPNTQKLFAAVGEDKYSVQGTTAKRGELDITKPVEFLYEDDTSKERSGIENGSFVNKGADNVVLSLD